MFKFFKTLIAAFCLAAIFQAASAAPTVTGADETSVHADSAPVVAAEHLWGSLWRRDNEGQWQMEQVDFLHLTPVEWLAIKNEVASGDVIIEQGIPMAEDQNGELAPVHIVLEGQ